MVTGGDLTLNAEHTIQYTIMYCGIGHLKPV